MKLFYNKCLWDSKIKPFLKNVGYGVILSVLATVLISCISYLSTFFRDCDGICGDYDAYIYVGQVEAEWGVVKIRPTWFPFDENGYPVKLSLEFKNNGEEIFLEGDALYVKNRYLVGHYTEPNAPTRRRSGAFNYILDGEGKNFSGLFVYVDPNEEKPKQGKAIWKFKKKNSIF